MNRIRAKVLPDLSLSGDGEKEIRRAFASNVNHEIVLDIKRYYPPRSNQQNKAVMGYWMGIVMKENGNHPHEYDSVYRHIKRLFWYEEKVNKKTGEVYRLEKPSRDLDKWDYSSQFMEGFRAAVLDFFGIWLPDPEKTKALI